MTVKLFALGKIFRKCLAGPILQSVTVMWVCVCVYVCVCVSVYMCVCVVNCGLSFSHFNATVYDANAQILALPLRVL